MAVKDTHNIFKNKMYSKFCAKISRLGQDRYGKCFSKFN